MADFGEYMPFDAVLADGTSAYEYHNRYPLEWAKVNQEAIESVEGGEDLVYFMRAGN